MSTYVGLRQLTHFTLIYVKLHQLRALKKASDIIHRTLGPGILEDSETGPRFRNEIPKTASETNFRKSNKS